MSTPVDHVASLETPGHAFMDVGRLSKRAARLAGVLFIAATASTMAGQMILAPVLEGPQGPAEVERVTVALAVLLELTNGLASAGIAIVLYPLLRLCAATAATGYLGLRLMEGTLGVAVAAGLMISMGRDAGDAALALALHDALFLLVLIVFSVGTLVVYPVLFVFRLVPRVLSLWGLVGGLMLLASCVLILFGRIEIGGTTDLILSLPIWINEMVLALWLLVRGFDLTHAGLEDRNA